MYSSIDDIRKAIPEDVLLQLTDDTNSGGIDAEKVEEAIASADAEIDGLLASRFKVPFEAEAVPALIRKYSIDIAIYNLYSRIVETVPETRADRYKNAIRTLEKIAEGKIGLGETPEPPTERTTAAPEITSSPRLFSRDRMRGL